jgi:tetratricopeptide (TPR) repeat protein
MAFAVGSRDQFLYCFLRNCLARSVRRKPVPSGLVLGDGEEEAAYALAHRLLRDRDLAAALKLFSLLRLLVPSKPLYAIAIALTLFEGENFFDAALHFLGAYVAQPERPELALWAGKSLIRDGRWPMAASLLRVILALRSSGEESSRKAWERVRELLAWAEEREEKETGDQPWENFLGQLDRIAGRGLARRFPSGQLCCVEDRGGGENLSGRVLGEGLAVLRRDAVPRPRERKGEKCHE